MIIITESKCHLFISWYDMYDLYTTISLSYCLSKVNALDSNADRQNQMKMQIK